jgi:hypothetical protein
MSDDPRLQVPKENAFLKLKEKYREFNPLTVVKNKII